MVAVPASSPANTLGELLALAKSKKGGLSYGSAGSGQGNHLGMELLKTMAGFDAVHVPFSGTGPVTSAVLAGQVDVAMLTPPGVAAAHEERPAQDPGDHRQDALAVAP